MKAPILLLLCLVLASAYYVRQKTPYFKPYSPNYLFGETFISNLDHSHPSLNTSSASYKIILNGGDHTPCYLQELVFTESWCRVRPCYRLYLNPCLGENETCDVSGGKGHCKQTIERQLLPGDNCTKNEECKFAKKECAPNRPPSKSKHCAFLDSAVKCESTFDCEPGSFCESIGGIKQCIDESKVNEPCNDDEACYGNSSCHFEHFNDVRGKCIEFLSLEEGINIGITLKIKGKHVLSVAETENLLCKTGFVNSNKECAVPIRKASNKGALCNSNSECTTNIGTEGNCVASLINSEKRCAPLENDVEWQEALSAFKEYYKEVNPSLIYYKWYPHNHEQAFNKMRCKIYKAFYYGLYLDYVAANENAKKKLKSIEPLRIIADEC